MPETGLHCCPPCSRESGRPVLGEAARLQPPPQRLVRGSIGRPARRKEGRREGAWKFILGGNGVPEVLPASCCPRLDCPLAGGASAPWPVKASLTRSGPQPPSGHGPCSAHTAGSLRQRPVREDTSNQRAEREKPLCGRLERRQGA